MQTKPRTQSESEADDEEVGESQGKAHANSARVRREVNQQENSDVPTTTSNQEDTAESQEGKVIAGSQTRFIDIISEEEDATIKQDSA